MTEHFAVSNLGLFILVGTCMLIGSAIASTSKSEFLPHTRTGRWIVGFLIGLIVAILGVSILALWESHVFE